MRRDGQPSLSSDTQDTRHDPDVDKNVRFQNGVECRRLRGTVQYEGYHRQQTPLRDWRPTHHSSEEGECIHSGNMNAPLQSPLPPRAYCRQPQSAMHDMLALMSTLHASSGRHHAHHEHFYMLICHDMPCHVHEGPSHAAMRPTLFPHRPLASCLGCRYVTKIPHCAHRYASTVIRHSSRHASLGLPCGRCCHNHLRCFPEP